MSNNKHTKRSPTSPVIMQVNTIMRYHLTLKKPENNKSWWECGEIETLVQCWWKCKMVKPLWKNSMKVPQKVKNTITI